MLILLPFTDEPIFRQVHFFTSYWNIFRLSWTATETFGETTCNLLKHYKTKKPLQDNGFEGIETMWNWIGRRERDSNPRTCNSQRFSRPSQSTTLPSLRVQNNSLSTEFQNKLLPTAKSCPLLDPLHTKRHPEECLFCCILMIYFYFSGYNTALM